MRVGDAISLVRRNVLEIGNQGRPERHHRRDTSQLVLGARARALRNSLSIPCTPASCLCIPILTAGTCYFLQTTVFVLLEPLCQTARAFTSPGLPQWLGQGSAAFLEMEVTQTCVTPAVFPLNSGGSTPLTGCIISALLLTFHPLTGFSQNYLLSESLTREQTRVCFWGIWPNTFRSIFCSFTLYSGTFFLPEAEKKCPEVQQPSGKNEAISTLSKVRTLRVT